jgi:hypothetical protein
MEQLDTLTEGLSKGEHLLREYVRDLLCESYEDIVDLMIRLRINLKNDRDSFTLQDVLTDVRGIKNVITVRQIGPLQSAPEEKKWVNLDIGFEDDEVFDVPDLEKELRQITGIDMINVVMYNDVPWNEER